MPMTQVYPEKTELQKLNWFADDARVFLKIATKIGDRNLIGVHLLNPTMLEIREAIRMAPGQGFRRVIVHSVLTWPGA